MARRKRGNIQDGLIESLKSEMNTSSGITVGEPNDLVVRAKNRMKIYRPYQEQFHTTWDDNYSSYLVKYSSKMHKVPTRSELFTPVAFSTVENWLTKVSSAFFSGDTLWTIIPSSPQAIDMVNSTQKLIDYQTKIYGWKYQLYQILKATGIFGMSWTFFGWDVKIKTKEEEIEYTTPEGTVKTKTVKTPYIEQDRPLAVLAHPKEVYWDPRAIDVESAQCITREYFVDVETIEDRIRKNIYDQPIKMDDLSDMSNQEFRKYNQVSLQGYSTPGKEINRKRVKVWECIEDEKFYTILNETVLARDKHNPLPRMIKPVMLVKDIDLPFCLNAMGEIDPIRGINIEKNTVRNQRIDQASLSINKMTAVDENALIEDQDMTSRPGGIVKIRTMGQDIRSVIMPYPQGDVSVSSYNEESMLDNDVKEASGQQDYAIGKAPERREAKGTVLSLQQSANSRFEMTKIMPLMSQLSVFPKLILMLDKTYLTGDSIEVRIFDERSQGKYKFEQVKLEDIDINCDFEYAGSLGKSMRYQRAQSLAQLMEQTMAYQQNMTAQGYPRFIDHSVLLKQWGKESEWGELLDKAIMGQEEAKVAVSPQTMQKFVADQGKQPNPQIEQQAAQMDQQKAQTGIEMEKQKTQTKMEAEKVKLASKVMADKIKMGVEAEKAKQKRQHDQEAHDQKMKQTAELHELQKTNVGKKDKE
jgi:hypothetical protein